MSDPTAPRSCDEAPVLLSIVVPAWNEEAGIERAARAALACGDDLAARGLVAGVELVVVDDGSTDRTSEIVGRLASDDARISLVRHPTNVGLGGAVRSGLAAARGDLVFYTDADLPIDLAEVGTAIALMNDRGVEVVSAYRRRRTGEGPRRYLYSRFYNGLTRVVLGLPVRDVNFAAKLMRREVVDALRLESRGSFIDAELLARAQRSGFGIAQFAAEYRPRSQGASTLSSLPVVRQIVAEMWRLAPGIRRGGGGDGAG